MGVTEALPGTVAEPSSADRTGGRKVRLRLRLTAALLGLVIGLLLAELAIRLIAPQYPSWLDIFAKTDSPPFGLVANVHRTISTGETNWTVDTDAEGFRRPAHSAAPSDAPLILVLGDSYAFGMGVNYDQTFSGLIEQRLGGKFRVLDTGVPAYGPTQYRQVLERELARGVNPRAVVVATYTGNDFHDCIWDKEHTPVRAGILGNDASMRGFLKVHFHLYRLVSRAYHVSHDRELRDQPHQAELYRPAEWENGKLKGALEIYQQEFSRIRELCRARQIPVLACVIPTARAVEATENTQPSNQPMQASARLGPASTDAQYDLPARQAEKAMGAAGIPCIDLTPALAQAGMKKSYFSWDQHLSPTGNRVAADAILAGWPDLTQINASK